MHDLLQMCTSFNEYVQKSVIFCTYVPSRKEQFEVLVCKIVQKISHLLYILCSRKEQFELLLKTGSDKVFISDESKPS